MSLHKIMIGPCGYQGMVVETLKALTISLIRL